MTERNEKEGRAMGGVVEPQSSSRTHKRVKKPANRSLPVPARKRATDAEVALAVIAAGGRIGQAAEVLGKTSRAIRKRTGSNAAHKEMRGLPQKVRERFRKLVRDGMMAKLEEGDVRVLLDAAHSKLCADMEFTPATQEVKLSGKVDGDLRLGPLDERAAAERLKALEEARGR